MSKLVSLSKRRGFVFPTAEKYGGLQGFWDWGPLGAELKNNIKRMWWKNFVQERMDVVGLDSAIVTNPEVWVKSGHTSKFGDYLIECKNCNLRYKAEDILPKSIQEKLINNVKETENKISLGKINAIEALKETSDYNKTLVPEINKQVHCRNCKKNNWSEPAYFNLMVQVALGAKSSTYMGAYLRPETAQNIFVNFETVQTTSRLKVPFGVAQIGKAFRNEITPGNFIFRTREFEQMELEYFVNPKDDQKWFEYWVEESLKWFTDLGIKSKSIRQYHQKKEELAHYAKATVDIEFKWPFEKGWGELMGVANRTDFDLKAHNLKYKDDAGEFTPYVIEPSFGVERAALAFLINAYEEIEGGRTTTTESNKESEVVLRLHKSLAPIKVAVLPLSKKEPLAKLATEVFDSLKSKLMCAYDEVSSIGRRYRRQDEIGTPYCVTVDFESLEDKKVTVRDRDTMAQDRVEIQFLADFIDKKLTT